MENKGINIYPLTKCNIEVVDDNELLSLDEIKPLVDYVMSQAKETETIPAITLLGREVLENYDSLLLPIIEYLETFDYRFSVSVESSGMDLTEDQLQIMRRKKISPIIKFDWALEDGCIDSEEFINNVTNIINYFPSVPAEFKITPQNARSLSNIVSIISSLQIYSCRISPDYFAEWGDDDYGVIAEEIQIIKERAIATFNGEDIPVLFDDFIFMFRKIVSLIGEREMNAEYRSIPIALPCNRCGIGISGRALIAGNGDIHSCLRCKNNNFIIGNVTDGVSEEVVYNILANTCVTNASGIGCDNCSLNRICAGGCAVANFAINGNVNYVTSIYCHWMQTIYNAASDMIEYFDAEQTNDLFKDYFYGMVSRGGYYGC